ncbi:MAG: cyclodeaminase/cyclohydrolase family protein [Candidatus Limnocylindria bacterium]
MDEPLTDLTVRRLVERLATSDPVPGGGSAAALAGAMGAALVHMVVELTVGRPVAEGHEDELAAIAIASNQLQSELLELAELDAAAYDAVVRARRLPRDSDVERSARQLQVAAAVREATRVPLATARAAGEVLGLATRLAPIGNRNAISDVGVAALLTATAVRGALMNVEINLPSLAAGEPLRAEAAGEVSSLLATLDDRDRAVRDVVAERLR